MTEKFIIADHTVHLFRVMLDDFEEASFRSLLNTEELARADRFHFPKHRQRFVIARGILRSIISLYTNQLPQDVVFHYGNRGKPYLTEEANGLQFNLSHSDQVAVVALTRTHEVGIDIEKIESKYNEDIAKRFFSEREYQALIQLSSDRQIAAFYQLWASKEALIKAVGEGLYVPLGTFTVSLHEAGQWVSLMHEEREKKYYLEHLPVFSGFQCAFATDQVVEDTLCWEWKKAGPVRCIYSN